MFKEAGRLAAADRRAVNAQLAADLRGRLPADTVREQHPYSDLVCQLWNGDHRQAVHFFTAARELASMSAMARPLCAWAAACIRLASSGVITG